VKTGLNRELGKYPESGYVRCKKCGFMCNTHRDIQKQLGSRAGYGIIYESVKEYDAVDVEYDSVSNVYDGRAVGTEPTVNAGCPLCGTYLYNS
jgi:hypothetical protein